MKHIQARAELSQSTASQFMATLQRADLLICTRINQFSHYRRNERTIAMLSQAIGADV